MKIKSITLKHFRGIQDMTLPLSPTLNVLAGVNGAGKSSLLNALTILLSRVPPKLRTPNSSGSGWRQITNLDIQNGFPTSTLSIQSSYEGVPYEWSIVKSQVGIRKQEKSNLNGATQLALDILEQQKLQNTPLLAYYPIERNVLDVPLRIRKKHTFGVLDAYEDSLSSGANFRTFFEWFREREDLENEQYRDVLQAFKSAAGVPHVAKVQDNADYVDSQLTAVRQAIESFTGFSKMRVKRNPLRMELIKAGKTYDIRQLSDGEKCLLALIGDLARRLAIANPHIENALHGEGVILIDEIDMHLHPLWQREIVSKLGSIFPNCQFILSTHSPHILNHVQPEHIFLLTDTPQGITYSQPSESYGKSVNRMLEDLMGLEQTRPTAVADSLHHLFKTIQSGDLKEAKQLVIVLTNEIGDDPELVKAEVLIKRMELIQK